MQTVAWKFTDDGVDFINSAIELEVALRKGVRVGIRSDDLSQVVDRLKEMGVDGRIVKSTSGRDFVLANGGTGGFDW